MRRRELITLLGGGAVAWPLVTRAQQLAMPIIGFLDSSSADEYAPFLAAFRGGLNEAGFVEGRNVAIEYRWADGRYARLPALGDPVRFGLVTSLNRPGGNFTGVASLGKVLVAKRFELLRELVPKADAVAFLINPNNAVVGLDTSDAEAAASARHGDASFPPMLPPSGSRPVDRRCLRTGHRPRLATG